MIYILVYDLSLSVRLRVIYGRQLKLYAEDTGKFLLKSRDELRTAVRDDRLGRSVISVDRPYKDLGHVLRGDGFKTRHGY